jgi:ABC-type sugar transport system ATPase subunit
MIHELVRDVASNGTATGIASGDDAELANTCDRVLVMRDGRVAHDVHPESFTVEELGRLELSRTPVAWAVRSAGDPPP